MHRITTTAAALIVFALTATTRAQSADFGEWLGKLMQASYKADTGEDLPADAQDDIEKAWKAFEKRKLTHTDAPKKGALVFFEKPFAKGDKNGHLALANGDGETVLSVGKDGEVDPGLPLAALGAVRGWVEVRAKPGAAVLPEFLAWHINRSPSQRYLASNAEGTDQLSIRRAVLEAMPIAVPALQKQRLLVQLAETVQQERMRLEALIKNREQQLDGLAQRLLAPA